MRVFVLWTSCLLENTLLLYVTVCEKVVPWLNKHDDVIE